MKRILFISTRNPYSNRYSGDVIGSKKIIQILKKNSILDVVTLGDEKNFSKKNIFIFQRKNFIFSFINMLKALFYLQPIQFGLFYSDEMKKFVDNNASNYDLIFFYHIRSIQYLPKNYYGKKIIEMGDLYSSNYKQTFHALSIFNPFKYIYFLESLLVKRLEEKIFTNFDKIILFSKNEIKKIDKIFLKKIIHINISIDKIRKKFLFSKENKKILFIGNLKYLPNILAVKNFINDVMPKLRNEIPDLRFEVVGEIDRFNKFFLSFKKNVKFWDSQKNLDKFIKGSFCGLANLQIASGVQGKILSYMSYGLPVISSKKVANNFGKYLVSYNDNFELIEKIKKLKNDKRFSREISEKSLKYIKKFTWQKTKKEYLKIIKN